MIAACLAFSNGTLCLPFMFLISAGNKLIRATYQFGRCINAGLRLRWSEVCRRVLYECGRSKYLNKTATKGVLFSHDNKIELVISDGRIKCRLPSREIDPVSDPKTTRL